MSRYRYTDEKIPVHELSDREDVPFNIRLYYLKGNYSFRNQLPSMPGQTEVPHRHRYHEICFFTKGEGIHEVDFKRKPIQERSIHFVGAGQVHLLMSSGDMHGRVLAFSPKFLWEKDGDRDEASLRYPFFNPLNQVQILNLSSEEFEDVMKSVESLSEDLEFWEDKSTPVIQSHVQIVLEKCLYFISKELSYKGGSATDHYDIISRYKHLVELHFRENHQVQDYSKMMNITPGHLNRYCRLGTGQTALEILSQRILLEAQRLLLFTGLSSKTIAYKLGFEDPSYFSRFFKQREGRSPLEFRKVMQKKYHG